MLAWCCRSLHRQQLWVMSATSGVVLQLVVCMRRLCCRCYRCHTDAAADGSAARVYAAACVGHRLIRWRQRAAARHSTGSVVAQFLLAAAVRWHLYRLVCTALCSALRCAPYASCAPCRWFSLRCALHMHLACMCARTHLLDAVIKHLALDLLSPCPRSLSLAPQTGEVNIV